MFGKQNLLELETALSNKEDNVRINIHLRLNKTIKAWVNKANKNLLKGLTPLIAFGKNSVMQPHITIVIGELKKAEYLQEVFNELSSAISELNKKVINIKFKNLSFSENGNWAFLWAEENEQINNITTKLLNKLAPYVNITNYGNPHITLAKADNLINNVNVLNNLKFPQKTKCKFIDVGLCGKGGTVLKILNSYSLK